jgi:hypothetical protein
MRLVPTVKLEMVGTPDMSASMSGMKLKECGKGLKTLAERQPMIVLAIVLRCRQTAKCVSFVFSKPSPELCAQCRAQCLPFVFSKSSAELES